MPTDSELYAWLREHTVATGLSRWMGRHQFLDDAVKEAMGVAHLELTQAPQWLPPLPEPKTLSRGDEDGAIRLGYTADQMRDYARAALAQRQQVPEGWQLVPKEPTPEMLARGAGAQAAAPTHVLERLTLIGWHAMLAAAPALTAAPQAAQAQPQEPPRSAPLTEAQIDSLRGLDTASRVRFYEHDFYVLSNFSAFTLFWRGLRFDTSEAAYHFEKFTDSEGALADVRAIRHSILTAPSAHEAFKIAERNKAHRRPDWDEVKVGIMLDILREKAKQHEYVRRKLMATGDRELVEDSWRDDFWGWGPNRDGKNMLGKLWMQVRSELRGISTPEGQR